MVYVCPRCKIEIERAVGRTVHAVQRTEERVTVVAGTASKLRTLPTIDVVCPKCGNTKAYYWVVQTRSIDEPSTQFYECTKCGHRWREYS